MPLAYDKCSPQYMCADCWLRSHCHAGAAVDLQRLSSELAGGDESGAEESGFSSSNGSGDSIRQLEPSLDSSSASALTGAPPTRAHLPQAHEPPLAPPLSFSFSSRQLHPHSHSSRLSPPSPVRLHSQQLHQQQHQQQQHQLSVRVRDEGAVRSSGPATPLTGWSNPNAALEGRFARQQREGNLSQEFTARVLTDIALVASLISSRAVARFLLEGGAKLSNINLSIETFLQNQEKLYC